MEHLDRLGRTPEQARQERAHIDRELARDARAEARNRRALQKAAWIVDGRIEDEVRSAGDMAAEYGEDRDEAQKERRSLLADDRDLRIDDEYRRILMDGDFDDAVDDTALRRSPDRW